jgi:hypothetical protein
MLRHRGRVAQAAPHRKAGRTRQVCCRLHSRLLLLLLLLLLRLVLQQRHPTHRRRRGLLWHPIRMRRCWPHLR